MSLSNDGSFLSVGHLDFLVDSAMLYSLDLTCMEVVMSTPENLILALHRAGQPYVGDLFQNADGWTVMNAINAARLHGSSQLIWMDDEEVGDEAMEISIARRTIAAAARYPGELEVQTTVGVGPAVGCTRLDILHHTPEARGGEEPVKVEASLKTTGPIRPLAEIEKEAYLNAYERFDRCVAKAAVALGVTKVTFYQKLRQYGMHPSEGPAGK